MNQPQNIIPRLRRLAELEAAKRQLTQAHAASASLAAEIEALRGVLPTAILSHHDARLARGKVSVAPVVRGICRACHIAIPKGHLAQLRRSADALNVCDHCGVFIYLEEEDQPDVANEVKSVAPGKGKTRPRKTKASRTAIP